MQLSNERYIFRAIQRRLNRSARANQGSRWEFIVGGNSIFVKHEGIGELIKVLDLEPKSLKAKSFIDEADFSNAIMFNSYELQIKNKIEIVRDYLQAQYLYWAILNIRKL